MAKYMIHFTHIRKYTDASKRTTNQPLGLNFMYIL